MADMTIINQGWLLKSPPEEKLKKMFFKSKWRRRYFVLYVLPVAGGGLHLVTPSLLIYYKDDELRHKKGAIDLTQCDEVQSLLHNEEHPYLFSIKTRDRNHSRTYFLAADSDNDMHKWVDCLCDVLGMVDESSVPPEPSVPLPLPIQPPVTTPPGGVLGRINTNDYVDPPTHIRPVISSQVSHPAYTPPARPVPPVPELPQRVPPVPELPQRVPPVPELPQRVPSVPELPQRVPPVNTPRGPLAPLQPSTVKPHKLNGRGLEPEPADDAVYEYSTKSGSRLSDPSCTSISEQGNEEADYDIPLDARNRRIPDNSYDRPRAISNVTPAYPTDRVNSGASDDYYSNAPVQHQAWGSGNNGVNNSSDDDGGDYDVPPRSYEQSGAGAATAASRGVITTELDYTGSVKTAAAAAPAQYKDEKDGASSDDDGVYSAPKSHVTADDTYDYPPPKHEPSPPAAHGVVHRYVNAASTVVPTSQEVGEAAAVSRTNSNMGDGEEVDGIYSSPLSSSRYGQQPDAQMTAQSSAVGAASPSIHFTQRSRSFKRGKPNGVADVVLPKSVPMLAHISSSSSDSDGVPDDNPNSPPPAVPKRGHPHRP